MKPSAFREMTPDERERKQEELRRKLFEARLEAATGQLGHTHTVKALRRDLARLLTIEHEIRQEPELAASPSRPDANP